MVKQNNITNIISGLMGFEAHHEKGATHCSSSRTFTRNPIWKSNLYNLQKHVANKLTKKC
jgi:hypothetical protein